MTYEHEIIGQRPLRRCVDCEYFEDPPADEYGNPQTWGWCRYDEVWRKRTDEWDCEV